MVMGGNDVNAMIIFVDARGFTAWAEKVDNFSFIDAFSAKWYKLLEETFKKESSIKYLGDGAMIIQEIGEETTEKTLKDLLSKTITKIDKIDKSFSVLCKEFSVKKGSEIPLTLGWGITKGTIKKLGSEYIGAEINKSARYCAIARPFGIVIDAVDFQNLPPKLVPKFHKQKRKLQGINGVLDVWVGKEIFTQFITREHLKQSPEVHVAGLCFKEDDGVFYILLGKRNRDRKIFPSLYEGCGGQLAENELFVDGVKRHYKLEYGIDISVFEKHHKFYYIQPSNESLIQGIRFLCEHVKGDPKSENHTPPTPQWFNKEDLIKISEQEFIPGLKADMLDFFEKYIQLKSEKPVNFQAVRPSAQA